METQINESQSVIEPLKKVTPVSKYLAMSLFIILPFLGGWIGYSLAPEKVVEVESVMMVEPDSERVNEIESIMNEYITYTNEDLKLEFEYPSSWSLSQSASGTSSPSYFGKQIILSSPNSLSNAEQLQIVLSVMEISKLGETYDTVEDILSGKNSSSKAWVANPELITIAGIGGVTYTTGAEGSSFRMTKFENDGLAYYVQMPIVEDVTSEVEVYDRLIKTLKFKE